MNDSNLLNTIPKDLPVTNPLLFSFIIIIDAIKLNCTINGKSSRAFDKDLPAFEFAVNSWSVAEDKEENKVLSEQVLCALWKEKPDENDCNITWKKFPNNSESEKAHEVDYLFDFESWRNETFDELEQIVSALTFGKNVKFPPSQKNMYLSKIFGWNIVDGLVNYVYAIDSTANKFYGIGATFTLESPYKNCCPKISETKLQKNYFESLGFFFDNLL